MIQTAIYTRTRRAAKYLVPVLSIALSTPMARAEDTKAVADHVLSLDQVRQDVAKQSNARQANEAAIDDFFALPRVQKTLAASGVSAEHIRRSAALLDDKEQAAFAARAASAHEQLAGGDLTEAQVTLVILGAIGFAFMTVLILAFK
jgi:hypothetical protein